MDFRGSPTTLRLGLAFIAVLWMGMILALPCRQAAAQDEAKPAVQDQDNEARPAEPPKTQSDVEWFLKSSGWIGAFLFLLSLYFIALVVRLLVELRPEIAIPPRILDQCNMLVENKDFRGILNLAAHDDSFFSGLVSAGITELPEGVTKSREAMERVNDFKTAEMEKKISPLAVLGTLGPMIGLLGTLLGMINSFKVIAQTEQQVKTSAVAHGFSQALVLTFLGVGLSVPAIYFFAFFRHRVMLIAAEAMLKADELMRRIAKAARNTEAAPPPVPPKR
jgi:biopolymer transport protein ExbB